MELETTIAPAGFYLRHPELHHYTSLAGLEGILRSGVFWATHFQSLNDRSEVIHLRRQLTEGLSQAVIPIVNALRLIDRRLLGESRRAGGPAAFARLHAATLIESYYKVAFTGGDGIAMAIPYIASFCSHASDQPYERENGLLSQWRAYGKEGGCCLVLDTQQLIGHLIKEGSSFYWVAIGIDDVIYATENIDVSEQYATLIEELAHLLKEGLRRQTTWMPASEKGVSGFIEAATRFKHQGFKEEREVRIVAVPGSAGTAAATAREHPREFTPETIKAVRQFAAENGGRPYLRLFEGTAPTLPITRIIIGPSRHQDANSQRAAIAAGKRIKIVPSETPYVE